MLAMADGLHVSNGHLCTSFRNQQAALDALLATALDVSGIGAGGSLLVTRPSERRPLVLRITPLREPPSPFERFRPAALVRIIDPDAAPGADTAHLWRTLYGLTPAETRLLAVLLRCVDGLPEAAADLGVAYSTARTQLSAIFEKTGTRSQSQLVRLATQLES
jgi:DNA-binding CsgD family transcriptional regulator